MKKFISLLLVFILMRGFTVCYNQGGKIAEDLKIAHFGSEIYTEEEIYDAIDVIKDYFTKEFEGCTLTDITYAGDEEAKSESDYRDGDEDVIVLISSFDVDSSGGDGSLNANDTYTGWKWILVRDDNGKWRHVDHGYA